MSCSHDAPEAPSPVASWRHSAHICSLFNKYVYFDLLQHFMMLLTNRMKVFSALPSCLLLAAAGTVCTAGALQDSFPCNSPCAGGTDPAHLLSVQGFPSAGPHLAGSGCPSGCSPLPRDTLVDGDV